MDGFIGEHFADLVIKSTFGYPAPNISVVEESDSGHVGRNGLPTGCYGSIQNNESDFTYFPIEYVILDYEKVDPVQVLEEGHLGIMSTYKVENPEGKAIIYADIMEGSFKSFDATVWTVVGLVFVVFVGLFCLRKLLNPKKKHSLSPTFETFSHMIGQESTVFKDRSGSVISILMTFGFFLIMLYYVGLMATDLVVVTKPQVIRGYRDILNKKNLSVAFIAMLHDTTEFEDAEEGSIQQEFWNKFNTTRYMADSKKDPYGAGEFCAKFAKQEGVVILTSLFSIPSMKGFCKLITGMSSEVFGWLSSDPEGKQHTTGFIMRQGLDTELITKGKRRLKGLFEGNIVAKTISTLFEK